MLVVPPATWQELAMKADSPVPVLLDPTQPLATPLALSPVPLMLIPRQLFAVVVSSPMPLLLLPWQLFATVALIPVPDPMEVPIQSETTVPVMPAPQSEALEWEIVVAKRPRVPTAYAVQESI